MVTVYYYLDSEPKDYKSFSSRKEATTFLKSMHENPKCIACGFVR